MKTYQKRVTMLLITILLLTALLPATALAASGSWKQNRDKTWSYQYTNGTWATGWLQDGKTWYLLDSKGYMQTGWKQDKGAWYYLKGSGAMATGWQQVGKTWYYLKSSGAMATGWQQVGGKWYYMLGSGAMKTGWQLVSGKWYFLENSGAMKTGWHKEGSTWYYLYDNGAMVTGTYTIEGKVHNFNSSGVWLGEGGASENIQWKELYADYLRQNSYTNSRSSNFSLININNDSIPELYYQSANSWIGDELVTVSGNQVERLYMEENALYYLEGKNVFLTRNYFVTTYDSNDDVMTIKDGKFVKLYEGTIRSLDGKTFNYTWQGNKVSKSEYDRLLASVFDISKAKHIGNNEGYTYSQIFNAINNY